MFQDIRGKYGSEGEYVVTRPVVGYPLNPTKVDHTTDAYDTIDWLVKRRTCPNRTGASAWSAPPMRVHRRDGAAPPASRVEGRRAESPVIDGWIGDDWFHYGAFPQANIGWIGSQTVYKGAGEDAALGHL